MRNAETSVALYSVSSDVDGAKIAQQMGVRANKAIVGMLSTASEPLTKDPQLVASMLQGAMAGVSRTLLESANSREQFDGLRQKLIFLVSRYLEARPSIVNAPDLFRPVPTCPDLLLTTEHLLKKRNFVNQIGSDSDFLYF
jgi:hypothetical protein